MQSEALGVDMKGVWIAARELVYFSTCSLPTGKCLVVCVTVFAILCSSNSFTYGELQVMLGLFWKFPVISTCTCSPTHIFYTLLWKIHVYRLGFVLHVSLKMVTGHLCNTLRDRGHLLRDEGPVRLDNVY